MKDKGENSTGRNKILRNDKGVQFNDDDLREGRVVVDPEWFLKKRVLVTQLPAVIHDENSIGPDALESYVINGTLYKMIADRRGECVKFEAHRKPRKQ